MSSSTTKNKISDNSEGTAVKFNPFDGPSIERVLHTTKSQEEIWIACKMGGDDANRAYNESVSLILKGEINYSALEEAVQNLVIRHEILRSVFSANGNFISIREYTKVSIDKKDYSNLNVNDAEAAIANYRLDDANHVFDLINGPLFKIGLLKISDLEHELIITAHHIICDGWSMGILLEELGALYTASIQNSVPDIPDVNSFSSYADEMQAFLGSDEHKNTVQFWLDQFKAPIPQVNLPTDFPRPELRTNKSERLDFGLDAKLLSQVKKVGVQSGCSLVTTMLAAFEVLMYIQTGQDDIVLGLPSAGQAATSKTQLIGHCVNLLPLRSKIDESKSFVEYLKERKMFIFDAYDHQLLSFGELLQELQIQRDPSRVPLVPVVFNIDMGMDSKVHFSGLEYKLRSNPRTYETFEIFLNASGSEDEFILEWSYNTTLFKPSTIKQMMSTFEEILQTIVDNPEVSIGNIHKVDDSEYLKLNQTELSYPELPLHELILKQAKNTPNNIALKFGDKQISYAELEKQTNQIANYLTTKGVEPDTCVGVLLTRSIDLVTSLIAILECGAAYLPLDPIYPEKRLEFMLEDSEAKYIITTKALSSKLQTNATKLYLEDILKDLEKYPNTPPDIEVDNQKVAYILYTSGSTGKPKGVSVTHRNLVNLFYSVLEEPGIYETDTLISITTISFDIAGVELFAPLLKGAKLVLADEETVRDTRLLLDLIKKEGITMMQATPATWQMLLDSGWNEPLSIRAISTGEALPIELAKKIVERVDELWNLYGPTETTVWSAIKQISKDDQIITIGKPIANTQLYVVNEKGALVAQGKTGELCIAGDGVANGYWKRPELTSEKFIDNPFSSDSDSKLYKTGDLAKLLPSGDIHCLGRIDQQIKIRGYRIELGEIEQALDAIDGIESSVVLLYNEQLIANVITNNDTNQDIEKIKSWKETLAQQLPKYMVPVKYNMLKEFPTTLNGKIDRKKLLESQSSKPQEVQYNEPTTESEKIIASIWQDCLGIEKIDVNSDFFELGGHSLVGNKAMALLEKETGKRVPLVALLKNSTVKKLAAYMDKEFYTWDSLVPLKPEGSKPPLYVVHGANHHVLIFNELAQNLDAEQPVYGLQSRGLNGIAEPHDSIDEMAADYIKEILASNPQGPYALAGFSYGGIVAYEMARQLKEQGHEVKILAQFDTYVFPQYYYKSRLIKNIISVFYLLGKIIFILLNMFSSKKNFVRRTELIKLQIKGLILKLRYGRKKQHEMQFNVPLKMHTNHNKATAKYTITPQDIVIDLFRATEEVNLVHDHKYLGWKKMALNGIRKHMVHGNHVDMFEKPHVKDFADILQKVLDNHNSDQL